MPDITNLNRLKARFAALKRKYNPDGKQKSVLVGYRANYAIYVHEIPPSVSLAKRMGGKRTAQHKPGKQWKFLEQPAREMRGELARIIQRALKNGAKMQDALMLAGLRLQRESQKIVPVDTGNLKGSAFTRKE